MYWIKIIFWLSLFVLFYCFIGYTLFLWVWVQIKNYIHPPNKESDSDLPEITFIVAAYNEKEWIEQKITNSLSLIYPSGKLKYLFVTDGSDDGTYEMASKYPQINLLHQPERKGKSAALNRAMKIADTPVAVFSDANTFLNKEALVYLAKHYSDPKTGGVSGEKKIETLSRENNAGPGEGFYWKYESFIKKLEAGFYSLVGSAGELFSIRTSLYRPIPEKIILDDFYTALKINEQGFKIVYEPNAVASENPSASIKEEKKRKVRIAAGAYQLAFIFTGLLNIFKNTVFTFQYVSHKLLRWFLAPPCIVLLAVSNFLLINEGSFYLVTFYGQLLFYLFAVMGRVLLNSKKFIPVFYVPYYFLFMNYCNVLGWLRYVTGKENVLWEKSGRQPHSSSP